MALYAFKIIEVDDQSRHLGAPWWEEYNVPEDRKLGEFAKEALEIFNASKKKDENRRRLMAIHKIGTDNVLPLFPEIRF